jgi:hypothetical protein
MLGLQGKIMVLKCFGFMEEQEKRPVASEKKKGALPGL